MFTGLIQATGTVMALRDSGAGSRLEVDGSRWLHRPDRGESIAVDGCCLTVAQVQGGAGGVALASRREQADAVRLSFDVVPQTLRMTALGDLAPGQRVNLEHAATPQSLLGGHIVQGHVDGVGIIRQAACSANGNVMRIDLPHELLDFVVPQGSIAVAGVSLTIAAVGSGTVDCALIPTTLELTNLGERREGDRVNIEVDCIAKTVVHWLRRQST